MSRRKIVALSILTLLLLVLVYAFFQPVRVIREQTASTFLANTDSQPYPSGKAYIVSRVVDGDTIVVVDANHDEYVRLIGVNTPETVDPRKPVQCFGREASQFLKHMLPPGSVVRLEVDPSQHDKDVYGRLLRYVYLDDTLVNGEIIQAGYGYEYTYDLPYQFQKEFRESEAYAKSGQLGLWSPNTCLGKL